MPKKEVKIVQISAIYRDPSKFINPQLVYGLGEDNQIYFWNMEKNEWELETIIKK
jgi:hypothetical protein